MTSSSSSAVSSPAARANSLAERVRRHIAEERLEATPAAVVTAVRREADAAVLGDPTVRRLAGRVRDQLVGAGPLAPLLADPAVTDRAGSRTSITATPPSPVRTRALDTPPPAG